MKNFSCLREQAVRLPAFGESALLLATIISLLVGGILFLKLDIHSLLIASLVVAMLLAWRCGHNINDQIGMMSESVQKAMGALIIFFLIGMIIAAWILGGTIPALIFYGLELISPAIFLPAGFLVCCALAYSTGTSWGTAATVGIALVGMGMGLGLPLPAVAGMVVSGCVFGDKMSPVSDTTVLASASAEADMYDHISAMNKVNIPVIIFSVLGYFYLGTVFTTGSSMSDESALLIQSTIASHFDLTLLVLSPIVATVALTFLKVPAPVALFTGVVLGGLCAVLFQGADLATITSTLNYGYSQETGVAMVDKVLMRGGIQNMMWTFSLTFIALCLGGLLDKVGFLKVLLEKALTWVKNDFSLVLTTLATCILGNAATSEVYLSIILNGSLYKDAYRKRNFKPAMLSRLLEEGATATGFLLPWTTAGAFMTATLGATPLEYMPYALYTWLTPLVSLGLIAVGRTLLKTTSAEQRFMEEAAQST